MSHCSYVYITICREKVNTVFKCFVNWELVKKIVSNPRSPWQGIRNATRLRSVAERSGT